MKPPVPILRVEDLKLVDSGVRDAGSTGREDASAIAVDPSRLAAQEHNRERIAAIFQLFLLFVLIAVSGAAFLGGAKWRREKARLARVRSEMAVVQAAMDAAKEEMRQAGDMEALTLAKARREAATAEFVRLKWGDATRDRFLARSVAFRDSMELVLLMFGPPDDMRDKESTRARYSTWNWRNGRNIQRQIRFKNGFVDQIDVK